MSVFVYNLNFKGFESKNMNHEHEERSPEEPKDI